MPKSLSLYLSYDSPRNPYKEPWRVVEEVKLGILNPQGEMLTDNMCEKFYGKDKLKKEMKNNDSLKIVNVGRKCYELIDLQTGLTRPAHHLIELCKKTSFYL